MEQLLDRKNKLERRLKELSEKQKKYSRGINDIIKELNLINNTINPPEITVSDHALIRYIERLALIHLDDYKRKLIEISKDKIYQQNGSGDFNINNIRMIVKDFNIVTIINKDL